MTGFRKRPDGGWDVTPEDDTEIEKDHDEALRMNMDLDGAIDWARRHPDNPHYAQDVEDMAHDVRHLGKDNVW